MKASKKIIMEELIKIHGEYMVAKALAINDGSYYRDQDKFKEEFFGKQANNLLSKLKIPEEKGIVIAEGKITEDLPYSKVISQLLAANMGKEVKIILERKK